MPQTTPDLRLASLLNECRADILTQWLEQLSRDVRLRADQVDAAHLRQHCRSLLDELARAVSGGNLSDVEAPEYAELRHLLAELSTSLAQRGLMPMDTAGIILSLRHPLVALAQTLPVEPDALRDEMITVNRLIDRLGLVTFSAFDKARESIIARQQDELMELSVPVIRLWDGVLCLPIIGVLDSSRALLLTERLLEAIAETNAGMAIIDITGVPTVDTATAQHLMKTVQAVRLMGAECVISGIRPAIATTIVGLGIDLSGIVTRFSLGEALRHCFRQLGLRVLKDEV